MKVAQLFSIFSQLQWGDASELDVLQLTQDSRRVTPGTVFVAIRGTTIDGHAYLSKVVEQGAIALVVEDSSKVPQAFKGAVVKVESTRLALDRLAQRLNGNPAAGLFCIGVTGTNGKTTVTYMIEKILATFGWPTGILGTIDHHLGDQCWPSSLTTPDPLTLQSRLRDFVDLGAQAAAFEVSSHALSQARVDSLPFAVAIFTNFTRDHLDYHQTMEAYFQAKERLFFELLGQNSPTAVAILNGDDPWVRKTRVREGVTTWWFGKDAEDCEFKFKVVSESLMRSVFDLSTPFGECQVTLPAPGAHNIYNAVAAIAVGCACGVSLETSSKALAAFYGAPGRLEQVVNARGLYIFVDYAHTDDALRTVGTALRASQKSLASHTHSMGRILTVFGCGGDRDRGKRPLMAKAATEFSDLVVLTSDNPRSEDPRQILADVRRGVPLDWHGQVIEEVDRRKALSIALQTAREGDVILIAGKGHEDYQIIGDQRLNFSDKLVVEDLLREKLA